MAASAFALTSHGFAISVANVSARVVIPTLGIPVMLLLRNFSEQAIFVALGDSSVVATAGASVPIMPGAELALAIGSATNIAAVTFATFALLNVSPGA